MKKFVVCPGHVWSEDGDTHFINYRQLIKLYNVNHSDCVLFKYSKPKNQDGLIYLKPKSNGDYSQFWRVCL